MAPKDTGAHPPLAALSGVRAVEDTEPDGDTLGDAAALVLEHFARRGLGPVGGAVAGAAHDDIAAAVDAAVDRATARLEAPPAPARASLPWGIAAVLATIIVLAGFAGSAAWMWQLDRRTTEAEAYDRAMAHWLVISNENSHNALAGLDQMMRALADAQGVAVGHIAAPVKSEPPTEVSMHALEALEK